MLFVIGLGAVGMGFSLRRRAAGASPARADASRDRFASGTAIMDQLVWRAFERQGYELVSEQALASPLSGTLRILVKEGGAPCGLLFLCDAPLFEKRTIQRFFQALRDANVAEGFLVAPGSFTIPAQRFAKEHRIVLMAREQLAELLSVGARGEAMGRALDAQRGCLEEAKDTIQRYAKELAIMRRQRNEASWFLGGERAHSGQLDAQLEIARQQLHERDVTLRQLEQAVGTFRRQWEESEWYLGEARARIRFFEDQLRAIGNIHDRVAAAERRRSEAQWYLGEERTRSEALEARLADLQRALEASAAKEHSWQASLDQLKQELAVLRTYGERRNRIRVNVPQAFVELYNGSDETLFSGMPHDVSSIGVGFETDTELPVRQAMRLRLTFPGRDSIETKAQLAWQQALTNGGSPSYRSGCHLVGLSHTVRALIDQWIEEAKALG